jgi:hypothetical protein
LVGKFDLRRGGGGRFGIGGLGFGRHGVLVKYKHKRSLSS